LRFAPRQLSKLLVSPDAVSETALETKSLES
jgi:hypothetical protein